MRSCPKRSASVAFRVTIHDSAAEFRLAVEGPIGVAGAADVEQRWRTAASSIGGRRAVLDLRGATAIEEGAGEAIGRLRAEGAVVEARGAEERDADRRMSFSEVVECMAYRLTTWARGLHPPTHAGVR